MTSRYQQSPIFFVLVVLFQLIDIKIQILEIHTQRKEIYRLHLQQLTNFHDHTTFGWTNPRQEKRIFKLRLVLLVFALLFEKFLTESFSFCEWLDQMLVLTKIFLQSEFLKSCCYFDKIILTLELFFAKLCLEPFLPFLQTTEVPTFLKHHKLVQ